MARRNSSKSSFNSLAKQPYFFAAVILIAVVAVVLMFSVGNGQTAKFSAVKKAGPGSGAGIGACYSDFDCQSGFHCESTGVTGGRCVKTPPPCVDRDGDGYGATGTDLSGCVDSQRPDCRDDKFSTNPGAKERCGNNIDEDCDGADLACPASEKCNGKDDDLDGKIDEDWPNKGQLCWAGVGACQKSGQLVCSANGSTTACNAVAGKPATEICGNGIDEDCNGADLACQQQCTDTDGGEVYDKKGTCTFWNAASQKQESRTDSCGPVYNYVAEYYCADNACALNYKNGICGDGALVAQCTDTDSGKDSAKKGTCTFWNATSQKQESRTDECNTAHHLQEFYCASNACTSSWEGSAGWESGSGGEGNAATTCTDGALV